MSDGKNPGWAFWTTAVVVVSTLYVLSSGPALWIMAQFDSEAAETCFEWIYMPLVWLSDNGPAPIRNLLESWGNFWDR